jgi:glycosyltransferase involved in cell wall biosynthesis
MKIAVDLTPMRPGGENGGVKPVILEFLKGLKRYLGDSLCLLFLTADDTQHEAATLLVGTNDCAFCVLRRTGKGNFAQTLQLATQSKRIVRNLLQKHAVDLLYCPFGTVSFVSDRIPTVAMIVDTLHRDFPFSLPAQTTESRELQFRKLINAVDYFQVNSHFTAERVKLLYDLMPEQIFITHLPIQGRLPVPIARREPFFFYPANFWLHKNHEVLLVAYQIYLTQTVESAPWGLVFTGHPDERAHSLQKLAKNLGIAAHVKFLGHVPEMELAKIYATASCLVFPSLHEGFGIPIVEAMSFGLPVICGRDTSIPEIAGNAAFYVDTRNPAKLAEALLTVARDERLRGELVALGKERLKAFDFPREVARLADLFADAIGRGIPAPKRKRNRLKDFWLAGVYYARAFARKALHAAVELPLRLEQLSAQIL